MFNSDIPLYSVMLFLAFVANIIIVLTTYEKEKFTKDEIVGAIIYENIGMICGAKLLTYLQDISMYNEFDFWSLGLSSYGAVLGGIVFLLLFSIQFKKKTKDLLLTFAPSLPLMYGIGKIGCFFVGCCYGIEYDGLGKIVYKYSDIAPNNVGLFPIQLLEAIIFIIIFFYILKKVIEKNIRYILWELVVLFVH